MNDEQARTYSRDEMVSAEFLGQFVGIVGTQDVEAACTGCGDTLNADWSLALLGWIVKHIGECGKRPVGTVVLRNDG